MNKLKYSEILKINRELRETMRGMPYQITILSNIITSQFNEIFEYFLRTHRINAEVSSGTYDNILQDSFRFEDSNAFVIFWELSNLIEGFHYKADVMEEDALNDLLSTVQNQIEYVFKNLKKKPLIVFNRFSSLIFAHNNIRKSPFERAGEVLNDYVEKNAPPNFILIDIDKVLSQISLKESADFRDYYSSKSLYTIKFYKAYAEYIAPIILSVLGKAKKALIFDCDNTLWKGVVGEDGLTGIEMTADTPHGTCYEEVQHMSVQLARRGVITGLCSKNNGKDIDEVLSKKSDMTLKNKHILIKKVNWQDKVSNLIEIARELNIGIESMVFVDDSDYEVNRVKDCLPEISVLKVPEQIYEYPYMLRRNMGMFYSMIEVKEDEARVKMYKEQILRVKEKRSFKTLDDYLESLKLKIKIYCNDHDLTARIAQLTQKTNQFNLTTKRYTEAEILSYVESNNSDVLAFDVSDRFGAYGVTGACILKGSNHSRTREYDLLLMSCRILGRNIELAFIDFVMKYLLKNHTNTIRATYVKTPKNSQVENFYENIGFNIEEKTGNKKTYQMHVSDYIFSSIKYIEIAYGSKD